MRLIPYPKRKKYPRKRSKKLEEAKNNGLYIPLQKKEDSLSERYQCFLQEFSEKLKQAFHTKNKELKTFPFPVEIQSMFITNEKGGKINSLVICSNVPNQYYKYYHATQEGKENKDFIQKKIQSILKKLKESARSKQKKLESELKKKLQIPSSLEDPVTFSKEIHKLRLKNDIQVLKNIQSFVCGLNSNGIHIIECKIRDGKPEFKEKMNGNMNGVYFLVSTDDTFDNNIHAEVMLGKTVEVINDTNKNTDKQKLVAYIRGTKIPCTTCESILKIMKDRNHQNMIKFNVSDLAGRVFATPHYHAVNDGLIENHSFSELPVPYRGEFARIVLGLPTDPTNLHVTDVDLKFLGRKFLEEKKQTDPELLGVKFLEEKIQNALKNCVLENFKECYATVVLCIDWNLDMNLKELKRLHALGRNIENIDLGSMEYPRQWTLAQLKLELKNSKEFLNLSNLSKVLAYIISNIDDIPNESTHHKESGITYKLHQQEECSLEPLSKILQFTIPYNDVVTLENSSQFISIKLCTVKAASEFKT